jgi:hypothetical protein
VEQCTLDDGSVGQCCRSCLTTKAARRSLRDRDVGGDSATGSEDLEDMMDVDLPDDAALSGRELALLQNLNQKIEGIQFESCNVCLEDGFNLSLSEGCCSRCRRDSADPVLKWSAANKVHPGECFLTLRFYGLLLRCFCNQRKTFPRV